MAVLQCGEFRVADAVVLGNERLNPRLILLHVDVDPGIVVDGGETHGLPVDHLLRGERRAGHAVEFERGAGGKKAGDAQQGDNR